MPGRAWSGSEPVPGPPAQLGHAALSPRRGRSDPPVRMLTGTEREIARLVATGQRNKEVASSLSVAVRTVEWNLSKIYRKLGVRSRTELAAHLARRPE
jgi:DNA-binding CsgD family transcriptional regulator